MSPWQGKKLDKYSLFKKSVEEAVARFKDLDKKETVRIVSHLDADGISACSILIKVLNTENMRYSVSIVPQLNEKIVKELSAESYKYYFFTDLGCGQLKSIKKLLSGKTIFILDHHDFEKEDIDKNIVVVNPHIFGIDGSKEISGSGIMYLFAKSLNKKNENMAHIAIIGAIGDIQERGGFSALNNEIVETAVSLNKIKLRKGLRIFGAQTKPLHKTLEYSTDPYIPGVTGSESGAIQFLNQIGISPKDKDGWKKIVHLSQEEIKKLITAIILKRIGQKNPEDVLGDIYILADEEKESPLRDAKEFATLLNACGRLNKASLGIGVCLGDKASKRKAIDNLSSYKKEIISAINWYNENKGKNKNIIEEKGFIIINAQDNVLSTIIGTVASIFSRSSEIEDGKFIMALAQTLDNTTKVSLRMAGNNENKDLRKIISRIAEAINGEAGGHAEAAGALIKTEDEERFIKAAKEILRQEALEEIVK